VVVDLWWMQLSRKYMQLCGNNSEKQGNYFLSSGHIDIVLFMQLFVGGGGKGVLLINCGKKLSQGVTKHLQACQKLQCSRAKFVYLLLDMSQVCMPLCVTSIQGWYHMICNIQFLNITYPSVITNTGLLCITYRRLVFAATSAASLSV